MSIREVYWASQGINGLISELYWRDFYAYLVYHCPDLLQGQIGKRNVAMNTKNDSVLWKYEKDPNFLKWCQGRTGVPMVDAGMRQMNSTGWMHNRARMITAMYLTKNLLIDWRLGEKYFATKLVDYDPCSNNGGWQWSSSTGCDSAPYFRIFNPFTQAKKFDPEGLYIKRYVNELKDAPLEIIMNWD